MLRYVQMQIIGKKPCDGDLKTQGDPTEREKLTGLRITSQRRLLLDLLLHAEGHLDADELYRRARATEPHLSLSTVYRTLKLFKELGLVEERHFTEEHHHYEVKPSAEHYHFICLGCGQVIEFESPKIKKMAEGIGAEKGFNITSTEVHIEGYCSSCRKVQKS